MEKQNILRFEASGPEARGTYCSMGLFITRNRKILMEYTCYLSRRELRLIPERVLEEIPEAQAERIQDIVLPLFDLGIHDQMLFALLPGPPKS